VRYAFGDCEIDVRRRVLSRGGEIVHVEPQVFDVLDYLLQHRDRVVSRDELIEQIWGGRFISDSALSTRIKDVRIAVGDDGVQQRRIKTLHRRGFRFIGEVTELSAEPAAPVEPESAPVRESTDGLPSIAVMPFDNFSRDPDQDYFVDGVCEDIITALSRIGSLFVIARSSTFSYKGEAKDVPTIASELNVRYILIGSVQKSGERIRISVQLLNGATAQQIWAERFDRRLEDVFDVQDEITENIVGALEPQVNSAEIQRSLRKHEQSLDAWDYVIRAMALIGEFTAPSSTKALELLDKAIEIDPRYARAHSQKAWTIAWRIHQGWEDTDEAIRRSMAAAEKAVQSDAEEPWAYIAWLFIATILRDADLLLDSPRRALQINPNFAMAHSWMGAAYALTGDGASAFKWIEKARKLSPRDMFKEEFDVHTSYAYFQIGDYQSAYASAMKAMLPHPEHVYPRLLMATSLAHLGNLVVAEAQARRIRELVPGFSLASAQKTCVFVRDNDIARFIDGLRMAGLA